MPRAQRAKEPSPVTVLVGQAENSQPAEQKPPQPPEEKSPTWFWDKLQQLPLEDWKAGLYQVWLIRNGDSRVPMAAGEKGYLDMFIEPITPATVKAKYGGGKYTIVLNRRGTAVTSHNFEIEGKPIYDYTRERPGNSPAVQATQAAQNSDNAALAREFVSILRDELQHAREANQAPNAANDASVEMMARASEKAMAILEKRTPEGGNPATMIKDLVEAMKTLGVVGGQQQGSLVGQLVHELTPLVTLLTPLFEKFFKPADPIAEITKYKTLFDTFGGGRGGSSRTTTEDLILEGIKTLPEAIRSLQAEKRGGQPAAQPARQLNAGARTPAAQPARWPVRSGADAAAAATTHPTNSNGGGDGMRVTPIHGETASGAVESVHAGPADQAQPTTAEEFKIAWVKRNIVEMMAMGDSAENIAVFIDMQKPDLAADIGNYDLKIILAMVAQDAILSQLTQIQFYELKLEQVRNELIAIAAEAEEITDDEEPHAAKVN